MVEVECPLCTKTVDLGSDSSGAYECPYCDEDFEYESKIKNHLKNNQSQFGYMMHGVKKATKPFAGYYRLGVLRDFNEEEIEQMERAEEKTSFLWEYVITPIFLIIFIIPILIDDGTILIQRWKYKLGGHPGKKLTEVDHLYIHPDGRVIVPLSYNEDYGLAPFRFNILEKMRIVTHSHDGEWCSVSILKGRKCYFSLGPLPRPSLGMWPDSDREEIYQFLRRFNLKESERHTWSTSAN